MSERMENTTCEKIGVLLSAFIDGECSPQEKDVVEKHLQECALCADQATATRRLETRFRREFSHETTPPGLWDRVLDVTTKAKKSDARAPWLRIPVRWPAIAATVAVVLVVIASVISLSGQRDNLQTALVMEPINDFITYRLSNRPLDVESTDPAFVVQWFAGKIDYTLPLYFSNPAGYKLAGSRLCYFLNRRLSALAYQSEKGVLSLYVMPDKNLIVPEGQWVATAGRKIASYQAKGYTNLIWREGRLVYSLVSSLPESEMLRFVADIREDARRSPRQSVMEDARRAENVTARQSIDTLTAAIGRNPL